MHGRTPIDDTQDKIDIIDHIHQDHMDELIAIVKDHRKHHNVESALVKDIFKEGITITINQRTDTDGEELFIPFLLDGDIEENIFYIAYIAMLKQGKPLGNNNRVFFEVQDTQAISKNMLRITIKSEQALPYPPKGHAYGLVLNTNAKQTAAKPQKIGRIGTFINLTMARLIKYLSPKNRQRLLGNMSKNVRYYTLRSSWKHSEQDPFENMGHIDIYTHGETPGGRWARGLKPGDIIRSQYESDDKHEHLNSGQCLLVADETAYPALCGILDAWQNPTPPHIITLSNDASEQTYFDGYAFPEGSTTQHIVCSNKEQSQVVIDAIRECSTIDNAWGAFERSAAKQVRHFLRQERNVTGKSNRIKGYWSIKPRP